MARAGSSIRCAWRSPASTTTCSANSCRCVSAFMLPAKGACCSRILSTGLCEVAEELRRAAKERFTQGRILSEQDATGGERSQGKLEEAAADYNLALKLDPDNEVAQSRLEELAAR